MGYITTSISQIYKSILKNFNVNSLTATGNETNWIQKSPYFHFRFDEIVAQTCTAKDTGINDLKFINFGKFTFTEFNINSLTATDSEADLLQKSPFFHFRLAEKVT